MKRFAGWAVSAGLVLAVSAAHAQMPAPYWAVSDLQGPDLQGPDIQGSYQEPYPSQGPYYERPPYGAVPPAPPPAYDYGTYGGGPGLLPPQEVYAILRDNGFSPLGVPHPRGLVYTIAVIDRNGEDGRLVIDARNGRIIRFLPAYGYGRYGQRSFGQPSYGQGSYERDPYGQGLPPERMSPYGPQAALPAPTVIRGTPRPPAPVPQVASRAVPLPMPKPAVATAHAGVAPQNSATIGEAQPVPAIRPTQDMPKAQDLE